MKINLGEKNETLLFTFAILKIVACQVLKTLDILIEFQFYYATVSPHSSHKETAVSCLATSAFFMVVAHAERKTPLGGVIHIMISKVVGWDFLRPSYHLPLMVYLSGTFHEGVSPKFH